VRLSLQVQYAICALFDLAYNGHGEPVQVRVIGERQAIPARYLEQVLRRLRRARLVDSKRGPGGGYTLARTPEAISLRDILEAVEGSLDATLARGPGGRSAYRPTFLWPQLAKGVGSALAHTTLAQLCTDAASASVPRVEADSPMYFI